MSGYFQIALAGLCLLMGFVAGNRVTIWYEGYKGEHAAIVQEQHAAKGETQIIKDTNAIQKVIIHEKPTDCGNAKPPAGLIPSRLR